MHEPDGHHARLFLSFLASENYKLNVYFNTCINVAHSIYIAVTNANTCQIDI